MQLDIRSVLLGLLLLGWTGPTWSLDQLVQITYAKRSEDFKWNIGLDGGPDILSELTWEDVEIHEIGIDYAYTWGKWLHFELSAYYGDIYDGRTQDSDYFLNDRTGEFSRSYSTTSGDNTYDYSVGIGVPFVVKQTNLAARITIVPMLGYSYHEQHYRMTDGVQTFPPEAAGPIPGLDSQYETNWKGMWYGGEFYLRTGKKLTLYTTLSWHDVTYDATARWNLRETLAQPTSFTQSASQAEGTMLSLGFIYHFTPQWSYSLSYEEQHWNSGPGQDTVYFSDGTSATTNLNNAEWDITKINLSVLFFF